MPGIFYPPRRFAHVKAGLFLARNRTIAALRSMDSGREGAPRPGRGLSAHSRSRPCVLPVRIFDSVCELVVPPAGCLRRPGRFAPEPQTGNVPARSIFPYCRIPMIQGWFGINGILQ